jgi:hypothetical protein
MLKFEEDKLLRKKSYWVYPESFIIVDVDTEESLNGKY